MGKAVDVQRASRGSARISLGELRARLEKLERGGGRFSAEVVSTGWPALDELLSGQGLRRGALVEWLAPAGSGASWLALAIAMRTGRPFVAVDSQQRFCPLPLFAAGGCRDSWILVRPQRPRDESWAIDQALRCPAIGAVIAWPGPLHPHTFRRWQLACETSGAIGLLVRSLRARREPTWADVRFLVHPAVPGEVSTGAATWRLDIELIRCRDGHQGGRATLFLNELRNISYEANPLRVAAELERAAAKSFS